MVHILSPMEACESYKPWHDKASGKSFLKPDSGKCLHYYFYFMDERLGLVPAGADLVPIPAAILLQRSWLAGEKAEGCRHRVHLADNAFLNLSDLDRA